MNDDKDQSMPSNKDRQGIDKDPEEEKGHTEQVTSDDLKGKKVDADLDRPEERPDLQR